MILLLGLVKDFMSIRSLHRHFMCHQIYQVMAQVEEQLELQLKLAAELPVALFLLKCGSHVCYSVHGAD